MRIRITDPSINDSLTLDLDEQEADDLYDLQVNRDHAEEILEWWTEPAGRNGELHEEGEHIILVEFDGTTRGPSIGTWCHENNDQLYPLDSFPYNTLRVETLTDPADIPTEEGWRASEALRLGYTSVDDVEGDEDWDHPRPVIVMWGDPVETPSERLQRFDGETREIFERLRKAEAERDAAQHDTWAFDEEHWDLNFAEGSSSDAWWVDLTLLDDNDKHRVILSLSDVAALRLADSLYTMVSRGRREEFPAEGRQLVGGYDRDVAPCIVAGQHILSQRHMARLCPTNTNPTGMEEG